MQFTVHTAKSQLSKLIDAALSGEEVVIAKGSKPVVRLVPVAQSGFKIGVLPVEAIGQGDTHAWVWALTGDARLSAPAQATIAEAEAVRVSPISFFEIGQKVRIGKWPEMEPHVRDLPAALKRQGGLTAPMTAEICLHRRRRY